MGNYSHHHKYHKKYKVDARNDKLTTDEDTPLTISVASLLENDKGRDLEIKYVTQPKHGELTRNADGSYTYTPDANFAGVDYFKYKVVNEYGKTDWAKVKICVNEMPEANTAPVGGNDKFHVKETKKLYGDVSLNDTDAEGGDLDFVLVDGPSDAKYFKFDTETGKFSYRPDKDRDWKDERDYFTYRVVDEQGAQSELVKVTICIDDNWGKKKHYDYHHNDDAIMV